MDRREKTDFILEQVELCIEKGDYTQAGILSRKISTKYLKQEEVSDLKLKFYDQQITLAKRESKYLDVCKHYREVYDTDVVLKDDAKLKSVGAARIAFSDCVNELARFLNASFTMSS